MNQPNQAGFFAALFDFSFSQFIIPKIASVVYIIALVAGALSGLIPALGAFELSFGAGLASLVGLVIGFFLYAIGARIILEAAVALIRIAQNTTDILRNQNPPPPVP